MHTHSLAWLKSSNSATLPLLRLWWQQENRNRKAVNQSHKQKPENFSMKDGPSFIERNCFLYTLWLLIKNFLRSSFKELINNIRNHIVLQQFVLSLLHSSLKQPTDQRPKNVWSKWQILIWNVPVWNIYKTWAFASKTCCMHKNNIFTFWISVWKLELHSKAVINTLLTKRMSLVRVQLGGRIDNFYLWRQWFSS